MGRRPRDHRFSFFFFFFRCRGVIKEKSPDFRSPEAGISANTSEQQPTDTNLELSNACAGKFKGVAYKKLAKISENLFE